MNEEAIAARLRENIPQPTDIETATSNMPQAAGQNSDVPVDIKLDDMTQYKLHEYFGQPYRTSNEESKQRTSYIFETVADMIGTKDYGYVISKIRDIEQVIGVAHSDNRLYRLYQWLKLDNTRRSVDREMSALTS